METFDFFLFIYLHLCPQKRLPLTPEQINEGCYVDIKSNNAVFESLRNNPKVNYDGRRFSYKVTCLSGLFQSHTLYCMY